MARVLELVRRSDVDTLLVASFDALFSDRLRADGWRREMMAKYGMRALEVG